MHGTKIGTLRENSAGYVNIEICTQVYKTVVWC